jgi:hypothetical protein
MVLALGESRPSTAGSDVGGSAAGKGGQERTREQAWGGAQEQEQEQEQERQQEQEQEQERQRGQGLADARARAQAGEQAEAAAEAAADAAVTAMLRLSAEHAPPPEAVTAEAVLRVAEMCLRGAEHCPELRAQCVLKVRPHVPMLVAQLLGCWFCVRNSRSSAGHCRHCHWWRGVQCRCGVGGGGLAKGEGCAVLRHDLACGMAACSVV